MRSMLELCGLLLSTSCADTAMTSQPPVRVCVHVAAKSVMFISCLTDGKFPITLQAGPHLHRGEPSIVWTIAEQRPGMNPVLHHRFVGQTHRLEPHSVRNRTAGKLAAIFRCRSSDLVPKALHHVLLHVVNKARALRVTSYCLLLTRRIARVPEQNGRKP
jgi:hypothetical protein